MRYNYNPIDFSVDSGLIIGIVCLAFAVYYFLMGTPSYSWHNFVITFVSSNISLLILNVVGLSCLVKGLAGPTSAIFQTSCVVGVSLNAIFLGLIPSIEQVLASLVTISGVLIMILAK